MRLIIYDLKLEAGCRMQAAFKKASCLTTAAAQVRKVSRALMVQLINLQVTLTSEYCCNNVNCSFVWHDGICKTWRERPETIRCTFVFWRSQKTARTLFPALEKLPTPQNRNVLCKLATFKRSFCCRPGDGPQGANWQMRVPSCMGAVLINSGFFNTVLSFSSLSCSWLTYRYKWIRCVNNNIMYGDNIL